MNPEQSNIAMLGLFCLGQSVIMLRIVINEKRPARGLLMENNVI